MRRRIAPTRSWLVEHPHAVLAVRATLYLGAAAALLCLAAATVAFLGVVAAVAGVAALLDAGGGWLPGVVPVGGLGVVLCLAAATLVAVCVRRLDARVVAAAEPPDPLERVKRRYVDADIDEAELERRLERVLDAAESGDPELEPASTRGCVRETAESDRV